jgi:hypothetical protein
MAEVIAFPQKNVIRVEKELGYIQGIEVEKPKTSQDFLVVCKKFLTKEDYEQLLLSICDIEYYDLAEFQIRDIADAYFAFNK